MFDYRIGFATMVLLLVACTESPQEKGTIVINNNSDHPISDVKAVYTSAKRVDMLGNLPAHTAYTYEIQYTELEDSITINYTDYAKKTHSTTGAAYAAHYDKQRYVVDIGGQ